MTSQRKGRRRKRDGSPESWRLTRRQQIVGLVLVAAMICALVSTQYIFARAGFTFERILERKANQSRPWPTEPLHPLRRIYPLPTAEEKRAQRPDPSKPINPEWKQDTAEKRSGQQGK